MKNKIFFLTILFLMTFCFVASADVDIHLTNETEFNTTTPIIQFTPNLTADGANCTLIYEKFGSLPVIVSEINATNATRTSFPASSALTSYTDGLLMIACNDSNDDAGDTSDFNITSANVTILVNGAPTILSASVNQDFTVKGGVKTFSLAWDDNQGDLGGGSLADTSSVFICATIDFSISNNCSSTTYTSAGGVTNSSSPTYTVANTLGGGAHESYIFVVDDGGLVSDYSKLFFRTTAGETQEEQEANKALIIARNAGQPDTSVTAVKTAADFFSMQIGGVVPVWLIFIVVIVAGLILWRTKK